MLLLVPVYQAGAASSLWLEGSNAVRTNFESGRRMAEMRADAVGAQGGLYLALQRAGAPGGRAYFAEYEIEVSDAGVYRIWLAATPQNAGWTSPLYFSLDGSPFIALGGRPVHGNLYGLAPHVYFGWSSAGTFDLTAGRHLLRFEVREPRAIDNDFVCFIDSIWLSKDLAAVPVGIEPQQAGQPRWSELVAAQGFESLRDGIRAGYYHQRLADASEFDTDTSAGVITKLMSRPLPGAQIQDPGPHEFGVHGMEVPFVRKGVDTAKIELAYELLARAGVQSFRTAESCWHRLGNDYDNFTELDYQVDTAARYGMTQLLTVGYPSGPYRVGSGLSAVKPEYHDLYRDYLATLLSRYAGRGVIRYVELANEVDAPNPWWRDSTAQMYVDEMQMVKEAVDQYLPQAQTVAFAATYSRAEGRGGPGAGRDFVRECFDLGIDQYADTYSIHYSWPLAQQDFPAFIRRELAQRAHEMKPVMNTEEAAYGHPSDMLKLFARNFYLHDMPRVDYYLARDWYEAGTLIYSGLFDLDWNPKPRLLGYAAAADAMQHRTLAGMLETDTDAEVYVLEDTRSAAERGQRPRYAIVGWINSLDITERHAPGWRGERPDLLLDLGGLDAALSANEWNLETIALDPSGIVTLGEHPIVIYTDTLPQWPLIDAPTWLERQQERDSDGDALVPVQ